MPVYQPNNAAHLTIDLNNVLVRIRELYITRTDGEETQIFPNLADDSAHFWASEQNTEVFNMKIPFFKNLLRDMYSFVESYWALAHGKFNPNHLEKRYTLFKDFRSINNVFKHPDRKWPKVAFVKIAHIDSKQFDLYFTFTTSDNRIYSTAFAEFVLLFLKMVRDWKLVENKRPSISRIPNNDFSGY